MTTEYFMTGLFTHVDDQFNAQGINGKHPHAKLYVSAVIPLGLLFALKGGGESSLLSLVESRLWGAISPASDARPTLPPVEYLSGSDRHL